MNGDHPTRSDSNPVSDLGAHVVADEEINTGQGGAEFRVGSEGVNYMEEAAPRFLIACAATSCSAEAERRAGLAEALA